MSPMKKSVFPLFSVVLVLYLNAYLISSNTIDYKEEYSFCKSITETYSFKSTDFPINIYKSYSVAADNEYCSQIGKNILYINGSAVDAAIASSLCNGLMNAQSAGIGGGNFMVIYLKDKKKAYAINARERAPFSADKFMFLNQSSLIGGLATGIPGELYGFWEAHKIGGKLPWKVLFLPVINMCRYGFKVSKALGNSIRKNENQIRNNLKLTELFVNSYSNEIYKEGEIIKMPDLADTFEEISLTGIKSFYEGNLAKRMVDEINENGGKVSLDDFRSYRAIVEEPVEVNLDLHHRIYASPIPSSGVLVSFIMRIMRGFEPNESTLRDESTKKLFYHRLVESFKHAYAHRSKLGDNKTDTNINQIFERLKDEKYIDEIRNKINDKRTFPVTYYDSKDFKEDHGTAHISVISNGDAVSVTSSLNVYFGAKYAGKYTGVIFNNQMDDFSTPHKENYYSLPPSEANFIEPGKRPMSSMSPIIVVDNYSNNVSLVLGASGGSKIISSVAQVAIKTMWTDMNIKEAIDDRRVHDQLVPDFIELEEGFDKDVMLHLKSVGNNVSCYEFGGSIVQGIHRKKNEIIEAYCDPRKGGKPDGI